MATDVNQPPVRSAGADGDGADSQASGAEAAAGQAKEKAQQAAGQAQEKAHQAAGQAQVKLREQLDQRSAQAAEQINAQASDLRSVSEALREQGKDGPADAADRLAGYAERVGRYLRDKDADALLEDAEEFGRQRPWAAAAGGLAVGFAASRFLKASSRERYQSRGTRPQTVSPVEFSNPALAGGPAGAAAVPGAEPVLPGPGALTPGLGPVV
jgi:hypothetical protein